MSAKGGMMGLHSMPGYIGVKFTEKRTARARENSGPPPAPRLANLIDGYEFFRPPFEDYGNYITKLDTTMHERWLKSGYGKPWREIHQRAVENGRPLPTVDDWADQADYVVEMVGDGHIGIGLDLMSGPAMLDFDATSYPRITEALVKKGYSEQRIKNILGENWLRLFDSAKAP
jgi:microsomal dipeptidase-like Zn-dependent dipeptidase